MHLDQMLQARHARRRSWRDDLGERVIDVVPIPGTKHVKYLEENLGALDVKLTEQDLQRIESVAPAGIASGPRYPESMMASVNR